MYIKNINNTNYIKVNDTATQIQLKIFDNLSNPFDLKSAMQVVVVIGNNNGRTLTKIPDLLDDTGVLEFGLDDGDLLEVGDNLLEVHIIMPNGEKFVAPAKGYYKLRVSRSIDTLGEKITTVTLDYFLEEANRALDEMNTKVEYVNQTANDLRLEVATAIQHVDDTVEDLRQEVGENLDSLVTQEVNEHLAEIADVQNKIGILSTADDVLFQNDRSIFLEIDKYKKLRFQQGVATITGVNSNGYFRDNEPFVQVALTGYAQINAPNYAVVIDVISSNGDYGQLIVYDKTQNGFKVKMTGSASSVAFMWTLLNPLVA